MKPYVFNLFAGPGVGKSTMAAGLFFKFKNAGVNAELAGEFAKDLTWSRRFTTLEDQIYVFGKQHHRIHRLKQDCDVIIADSPILLGLAYSEHYPQCYRDTVYWAFSQYNNINFLLNRTKPYNPKGRNQTLDESIEKHKVIEGILNQYEVPYIETTGDEAGMEVIFNTLKKVVDIP
jgi:hypothetical protein